MGSVVVDHHAHVERKALQRLRAILADPTDPTLLQRKTLIHYQTQSYDPIRYRNSVERTNETAYRR